MISEEELYRRAAYQMYGSEDVDIDNIQNVDIRNSIEEVAGAWVPAWVFVSREQMKGGGGRT